MQALHVSSDPYNKSVMTWHVPNCRIMLVQYRTGLCGYRFGGIVTTQLTRILVTTEDDGTVKPAIWP
jgi:hypothetical protein